MRTVTTLLLVVAACGSDRHPEGDTPDGPAATDDAPQVICGTRQGMRGMTHRDTTIAGLHRTYLVYLPATILPSDRLPLVFVHHGFTMSGQKMVDATAYTALADVEHIALAFPDGQGGPDTTGAPWNVGTSVCPSAFGPPPVASGDDFAFLDAMRADIAADQCIDDAHVYVTGFSMGGYFSHHAGCMRSDIRAVAPHSGGTHDLSGCASAKKPVIMFHGLSDGVIPPGCDDPGSPAPGGGAMAAATAWAQHNGCSLTTQTVTVKNGTCKVYDGCPEGGQVELCTFGGMGHCWAGGAGLFACPAYEDATRLEWQFFRRYAW